MNIKDYLHLYLGCEVEIEQRYTGGPKTTRKGTFLGYTDVLRLAARVGFRAGPEGVFGLGLGILRPILRPLSDMTKEEFFEIGRIIMGSNIIVGEVGGCWCVAYDEGEWFDQPHIDNIDKIYRAGEVDHENVLSYDYRCKSLAYGVGDEMRFFVDPKTNAIWVKELLSRGFDLFGLINSGDAIEHK